MPKQTLKLVVLFLGLFCVTGCQKTHLVGGAIDPSDLPTAADWELSPAEEAQVDQSGFVVSGKRRVASFHFGYSEIFEADMPVYFTADAALHAMHASFDAILIDIETHGLIGSVDDLLDTLRKNLAGRPTKSDLEIEAKRRLDLYLTVAHSLLQGKDLVPTSGATAAQVAEWAALAKAAAGSHESPLAPVQVDLSMLKPRGHYTDTEELKRYFRCVAWLGAVDFRLATVTPEGVRLNREALAAAMMLDGALDGFAVEKLNRVTQLTDRLIGPADSMSAVQLSEGLKALDVGPEGVATLEPDAVAAAFKSSSVQRINGQLRTTNEGPISYWLIAPRYVVDSEVFGAVVYDQVKDRLMPSPLDIGAAVFNNPAALKLLEPEFEKFGYRNNLTKVTATVKGLGPDAWNNTGHRWRKALQHLSIADPKLPAKMHSLMWSKRMLNTQLASWAELRHDTILYTKQSFTVVLGCSFPDAYVEPYPAFFGELKGIAESMRGAAELAGVSDPKVAKRIDTYLSGFQKTMSRLQEIAEVVRRDEQLSAEQLDFMNLAVSRVGQRVGSGGQVSFTVHGWFADLYYRRADAKFHKPTVADVHTQPTDAAGNPVGRVLHVATGLPRMMEVEIVRRGEKQRYRGIVSSYYEHVTKDFKRLNDDGWRRLLQKKPPSPTWVAEFLSQ